MLLTLAARLAGSLASPVLVVNERWVELPAENAIAGIYAVVC